MRRTKRGGWPYSQPPNVPFEINRDSPQAKGLVMWMPLLGPRVVGTQRFVDRVQRRIFTPINAPAWTQAGWIGNALLFDDGAAEYLTVSDGFISGVPFTLTGWGYSNDATVNQTIVGLGVGGVTCEIELLMVGTAGGDPVRFQIRDAGGLTAVPTTTGFSIDTWHHAAAVRKATDDWSVFIDGGSKGTSAINKTPAAPDRCMVSRSTRYGGNYFSGCIADIRIYNRALTDAEIWQLYDLATRWELYKPLVPWTLAKSPITIRIPRYGFTNYQVPGIV